MTVGHGAVRYGWAQADLEGLIADSLASWDIAIAALADPPDLDAPSLRRGATIRQVLLGIGEWPGGLTLADRRLAASRGRTDAPPQRLIDAEIAQRFAHADIDDIQAAWRAARDAIEAWQSVASEEAALPVGGPLGVVPLGTLVGAGSVAIRRTTRDGCLVITDTEQVSTASRIALLALIDSVGAVCAQAPGEQDYRLAIITPDIEMGVCASPGSWELRTDVEDLPRIIGPTETVWQIATGTSSPVAALARREIEIVDVNGLMRIARGLTAVPDLPGGESLRTMFGAVDGMASAVSGVGRILARLRRD